MLLSRNSLSLIVASALLTSPLACRAEAPASPEAPAASAPATASTSAAAEPASASAGPVDEVAKLSVWEGHWKSEITFTKCDRTPKGGHSAGIVTVKRALGGTAYISNYNYNGDMGPYEGHMIMAYSAKNKNWAAWWFDSLEPATCDQSTGVLTGDTFVIDSESDFKGTKYKTRMTQKIVDPTHITEVYEADHGSGMKPEMNIVYTKMGK